MSEEWRPENWKRILPKVGTRFGSFKIENTRESSIARFAFETGANEILAALKDKGAWMTPEQMKLLAPDRKYPYGYCPIHNPILELGLRNEASNQKV